MATRHEHRHRDYGDENDREPPVATAPATFVVSMTEALAWEALRVGYPYAEFLTRREREQLLFVRWRLGADRA